MSSLGPCGGRCVGGRRRRLARPAVMVRCLCGLTFHARRELVANESAATAGEDRRATGEACAVLLAATGRGTSEPAAIRSHAGPDRAATATVGIVSCWPSQPRGICLQRVGVRKGVARVSWNPGQFRAVLVLIADRWGAPDENRLNNVGAGDSGVQCVAFSKSKRKCRTKGGTVSLVHRLDCCETIRGTSRQRSGAGDKAA